MWGYYLAPVLPQLELPILSLSYQPTPGEDYAYLVMSMKMKGVETLTVPCRVFPELFEAVDGNLPFPRLRDLDITIKHEDNCDFILESIKTRHSAGYTLDKLRAHISLPMWKGDSHLVSSKISTLKGLVNFLEIFDNGRIVGRYKDFGCDDGSWNRPQRDWEWDSESTGSP